MLGGKSLIEGLKSIERYDIERDEWVQVKMQLTYGRSFLSTVTFGNRYIYVVGGTTQSDCFEIIDTHKEDVNAKTELVLLDLGKY